MIKSMTGFGRCEAMESSRKFTVEVKSVNHRYLDMSIKMPKKLGFFESAIRALLKEYIQRGKVDVYITYEDFTEESLALKYNGDMAAAYVGFFKPRRLAWRTTCASARCPDAPKSLRWRSRLSMKKSFGRFWRKPCGRRAASS